MRLATELTESPSFMAVHNTRRVVAGAIRKKFVARKAFRTCRREHGKHSDRAGPLVEVLSKPTHAREDSHAKIFAAFECL